MYETMLKTILLYRGDMETNRKHKKENVTGKCKAPATGCPVV